MKKTLIRNNHTLLEMLFVVVCVAILLKLLMPAFAESRNKARFTRWLSFNRQCSNDPTCAVNFNFQDGNGAIVKNSAVGNENIKFDAKDYSGVIKGDYSWVQGRWWKGKRALQFNGTNTIVEIEKEKALNFDENEGFTIIIWVKFDRFRRWDGLFSKSYMAGEAGWSQYDLYYDGTEYTNKAAQGQFEVDVCRTCIGFDDVVIEENGTKSYNIKLDTEHWFMITLRNKMVGSKNEINVFINDKKLVSRSTNNFQSAGVTCDANLIIGALRFLVMGPNNVPTKNGYISNYFKGRVDEFIMYRRALEDSEVRGHFRMGDEHL